MDIKEFFENFLQDYDSKRCVMLQLERMKEDKYIDFIGSGSFFHEALQNFADRICEKQRIICASETTRAIESERDIAIINSDCLLDIENDIETSEQPEIDEL
jgi:hypothetical protein